MGAGGAGGEQDGSEGWWGQGWALPSQEAQGREKERFCARGTRLRESPVSRRKFSSRRDWISSVSGTGSLSVGVLRAECWPLDTGWGQTASGQGGLRSLLGGLCCICLSGVKQNAQRFEKEFARVDRSLGKHSKLLQSPGCLCLNLLSLQEPPREEEEEALAVTDRVQGRVPVGVPEQAVRTPAHGPLGQHLSRGESGLQPGALQVTPRTPARRPDGEREAGAGSGQSWGQASGAPVRESLSGLLLRGSPRRHRREWAWGGRATFLRCGGRPTVSSAGKACLRVRAAVLKPPDNGALVLTGTHWGAQRDRWGSWARGPAVSRPQRPPVAPLAPSPRSRGGNRHSRRNRPGDLRGCGCHVGGPVGSTGVGVPVAVAVGRRLPDPPAARAPSAWGGVSQEEGRRPYAAGPQPPGGHSEPRREGALARPPPAVWEVASRPSGPSVDRPSGAPVRPCRSLRAPHGTCVENVS